MPTNLHTVKDHPANIIDDHAGELAKRLDSGSAPEIYQRVATVLRAVEVDRDVTFAALDNQALANVREDYAAWSDAIGVDAKARAANRFVYTVIDLLGLADD